MTSLVQITDDNVSCQVSSVPEAKLAIKELKLLKKGFALQKKEVATNIQTVRFDYSQEVRGRGSVVRGGGGFGRFIRAFQISSRDNKRSNLADALQPLEGEKNRLDGLMHGIDELVVKLEIYIHTNKQ
jgi:hypothetical protein